MAALGNQSKRCRFSESAAIVERKNGICGVAKGCVSLGKLAWSGWRRGGNDRVPRPRAAKATYDACAVLAHCWPGWPGVFGRIGKGSEEHEGET